MAKPDFVYATDNVDPLSVWEIAGLKVDK